MQAMDSINFEFVPIAWQSHPAGMVPMELSGEEF